MRRAISSPSTFRLLKFEPAPRGTEQMPVAQKLERLRELRPYAVDAVELLIDDLLQKELDKQMSQV